MAGAALGAAGTAVAVGAAATGVGGAVVAGARMAPAAASALGKGARMAASTAGSAGSAFQAGSAAAGGGEKGAKLVELAFLERDPGVDHGNTGGKEDAGIAKPIRTSRT